VVEGPDTDKAVSVYMTTVLASLNLLGYACITLFFGTTEVPILIQRTDNQVKKATSSMQQQRQEGEEPQQHQSQQLQRRRDPGAFTNWLVAVSFLVSFVVMHALNYSTTRNGAKEGEKETPMLRSSKFELYLFLLLGVVLPWFIVCARGFVVVPDTPTTRAFVITFDCCVDKAYLRNHVLLMAVNVVGFTHNEFFSLLLLDIVNNSPLLFNVILCITLPAKQMLSVLYLLVVTAVVYAQFGLRYYENAFDPVPCHSAVSCFWLLIYKAVPAGSLNDVLMSDDNSGMDGRPDYMLRILFDISFFIWVGVLLFNIVTGLMIDMFVGLNQDSVKRSHTLQNEGFVNGLTRAEFDDLSLPNAPNFEDLNDKSQHVWNYVYFWYYLQRKRVLDLTGVEEYVAVCLAKGDQQWLPRDTSFVIQNRGVLLSSSAQHKQEEGGAGGGGEEGGESMPDVLQLISSGVNDIKREVALLGARLDDLEEKKAAEDEASTE